MALGNRLKQERDAQGITQSEMAEAIGARQSTINSIENDDQEKTKYAARLAKKLGVTQHWLETGEGPKHPVTGSAIGRIGITGQSFGNVLPGPDMRGMVPIISEVQAGDWAEVIDNGHPFDLGEGGEGLIACPYPHGIQAYALRVTGDSMTSPAGRSYPHGCLIFVDPDQRGGVVSGDRVIAKVHGDNKATFKVFIEDCGRRYLKPLNPQYPIITDQFRILGKVLGALVD